MNVIKAIQDINTKIDFIISYLQGEKMFDPTQLQQELTRAISLVAKSKDFINSLQATIKQHEATIASHAAQIQNSANVESTVASISNQLSSTLADFESFLNSSSNTAAPATQVEAIPVADVVSTPVASIPEPQPEEPTVIHVGNENIVQHVLEPRQATPEVVTRIGPLQA